MNLVHTLLVKEKQGVGVTELNGSRLNERSKIIRKVLFGNTHLLIRKLYRRTVILYLYFGSKPVSLYK